MLPLNEEDKVYEDELPLRWSMKKQRVSKGKEKVVDMGMKVTRSYSTRGSEQKLLMDAIKASKSSIAKIRRLKKAVGVEVENVKVVEVREGEEVGSGVSAATKKRKKFMW